jgi:hypothetical protein
MKKLLITSVLFTLTVGLFAQSDEKVVQVTGLVISGDSLYSSPFVTIYRESDYRGTFTDNRGYFTIPVVEGDTLTFVGLGYKKAQYVVPIDNPEPRLSIVQMLEVDVIELPTVYILPIPSPENLKKEFLAMLLPEDEYTRSIRSINALKNSDGLAYVGPDGVLFRQSIDRLHNNQTNTGYVQNQLLNPAAWAKFIQALGNGDFGR